MVDAVGMHMLERVENWPEDQVELILHGRRIDFAQPVFQGAPAFGSAACRPCRWPRTRGDANDIGVTELGQNARFLEVTCPTPAVFLFAPRLVDDVVAVALPL